MYVLYVYMTIYLLNWRRTVWKWARAAHADEPGSLCGKNTPREARRNEPPCGFCLFLGGFFWGSLMNLIWPWWAILWIAKWIHANKGGQIHGALVRLLTPRVVRRDFERRQLQARITELEKEVGIK